MLFYPVQLLVSVLVSAAVIIASLEAAQKQSLPRRVFFKYVAWWKEELALSNAGPRLKAVPIWQLAAITAILALSFIAGQTFGVALALPAALAPPRLLSRYRVKRVNTLQRGLDGFLVALADSLTTVPNLAEALHSLIEHMEPPIKDEVIAVLAEVRLGRSLDEALLNMASRLKLPGMDAAVGAALLGKRTGGDLPTILRRIASTLREMQRLEGIIKTKTAEAKRG
jgi:tight adherence protein B